ncbi:MAG TPA: molybdenum cofactor guanylyltransferase [Puia sp.]|jgi:molybdopterin-guanine dinucleotide biosynthesis protein A|nr:molybdenum cofactor guanylyltransferase [Puia sp.]
MNNLLGVVLCGGESRRMGRDKGLLERDGVSWAQYVAEKFAPFDLPVIFSVRPGQTPAYRAAIPAGSFLEDKLDLAGPLNGLLSVHATFPEKDILLLACDMLDVDEATIRDLIGAYRSGGSEEFYVYQEGAFAQPFCGIYTAGGLASVYRLIREDGLDDFSLQSIIRKGKTRRLKIPRMEAFANYNSL